MFGRAWRRFRWWWLLVGAAAVSAVVGLIAQSLPLFTGLLLVGVIGGLTGMVMTHAQRGIDRDDAAPRIARQLTRVRDLGDPRAAGIHAALPPAAGEQLIPPFVARDQSAALEDLLGVSRFVLIVGESTAGKSRMAYEAMRSRLPGHVFIHPEGKHDLADALRLAGEHKQGVLWLDDLESYLGPGGLTANALSPLLSAAGRHTVQALAGQPRLGPGGQAARGRAGSRGGGRAPGGLPPRPPRGVLERLHDRYLPAPTAHVVLETWDEAVQWSAFGRNRPLIAELALQKAFDAGRQHPPARRRASADAVEPAYPRPPGRRARRPRNRTGHRDRCRGHRGRRRRRAELIPGPVRARDLDAAERRPGGGGQALAGTRRRERPGAGNGPHERDREHRGHRRRPG